MYSTLFIFTVELKNYTMKKILEKKALEIVELHYKEYKRTFGEEANKENQCTLSEQLERIYYRLDSTRKLELTDEPKAIYDSYYQSDNDHEFNSLITDYMFKLGKEGESRMISDQNIKLNRGLEPILRKIAADIFAKETVSFVLDKQEFTYAG